MSLYPGPEYLRTGEYDECEHGIPTSHECPECMATAFAKEREALEDSVDRLDAKIAELRALAKNVAEMVSGFAVCLSARFLAYANDSEDEVEP